jgi:hypothetical protein
MSYLITQAEVVALAFTDKNFLPAKVLASHIAIAHEGFLRPAIGDEFYMHLTNDAVTVEETNLINTYLKPPIAWWVRYIILPDVIAHVSNTGVQLVQPQGTVMASDKQAGLLRDQALENAKILMDTAIRFIVKNELLFPLYSYSDTVTSSVNVRGGVIFGGSRTGRKKSAPAIETVVQTGTFIVNTLADLRMQVNFANGSTLICNENNGWYQYDVTATGADDGEILIQPTNTTIGRWIKKKEIQFVNL